MRLPPLYHCAYCEKTYRKTTSLIVHQRTCHGHRPAVIERVGNRHILAWVAICECGHRTAVSHRIGQALARLADHEAIHRLLIDEAAA